MCRNQSEAKMSGVRVAALRQICSFSKTYFDVVLTVPFHVATAGWCCCSPRDAGRDPGRPAGDADVWPQGHGSIHTPRRLVLTDGAGCQCMGTICCLVVSPSRPQLAASNKKWLSWCSCLFTPTNKDLKAATQYWRLQHSFTYCLFCVCTVLLCVCRGSGCHIC